MGKTATAAVSLVAVIPAAFLLYVVVTGYLGYADDMSTTLVGVLGMTALVAALLMVTPFGILVFGKSPAKRKQEKGATPAAAVADDDVVVDDVDVEPAGASLGMEEIGDESLEMDELEGDDDFASFDDSSEFSDADFSDSQLADSGEFDDSLADVEMSDEFEMSDDFEDDEQS